MRSWFAAIALLAGICQGCGGTTEEKARAEHPALDGIQGEDPGEDLEHLKSLPYISWDGDTDTSRSGVTLHDAARTSPGYNLYTDDQRRVFLSDIKGKVVHQWNLPRDKKQCELAKLLNDGGLIVECVDQSLTRIDWNSELIWDRPMPVHHDIAQLPGGEMLVPYLEDKVYQGRQVGFDGIARVSAKGNVSPFWSSFESFEELRRHHAPSKLDAPPGPGKDPLEGWEQGFEYYHLNSVSIFPETRLGREDSRFRAGNLLICLRNVNLVAILDQDDLSVVWKWGEKELDLPHDPTVLPGGNLLIFDNGTSRGWSRVVEIDPRSGEIVWSYQGSPRESFFSKWRGSSQRLPNGNTLIAESERGHVFEVTRERKIVWEFWNPEIVEGRRKRIYRFGRLQTEAVEPLLHSLGGNQGELRP
jgi:hypothetical protein